MFPLIRIPRRAPWERWRQLITRSVLIGLTVIGLVGRALH